MKYIASAIVMMLPVAALAVDSPLDFSGAKIALPPLSLAASAEQAVPSLVQDLRPVVKVTVVDRMPILAPNMELDPKMVKTPDSSINYDLIVKTPDVLSDSH